MVSVSRDESRRQTYPPLAFKQADRQVPSTDPAACLGVLYSVEYKQDVCTSWCGPQSAVQGLLSCFASSVDPESQAGLQRSNMLASSKTF